MSWVVKFVFLTFVGSSSTHLYRITPPPKLLRKRIQLFISIVYVDFFVVFFFFCFLLVSVAIRRFENSSYFAILLSSRLRIELKLFLGTYFSFIYYFHCEFF